MSSTNKTTNYELSQFLGSDKPAWLSDYNTDMSKIDTGIHAAQTTATGADGKADANASSIGNLTNLTTDAKSNLVAAINEVQSETNTAQTSAGTALSTANTAGSKADAAINGLQKFNLTSNSQLTPSTDRGSVSQSNLYFATDSTSSIFKVYGSINLTFANTTGLTNITLGTTSLRPDSSYTIVGAAYVTRRSGSTTAHFARDITVATNGVITLQSFQAVEGTTEVTIWLPPCLYFNTDFGDAPTPSNS